MFGKDASVQGMATIAEKYPVKFDQLHAVVQDFHSVGQALNVASADQRLLVLVSGPEVKLANARESLKPVVNSADFLGRLHVDFETGDAWSKAITNEQSSEGIMFIAAGEFGLHGAVLSQLPLDATHTQVREALIKANKTFTATTRLKNYMEHVQKGNLLGIRYKSAVPYGEDRNGDGQIDRPADGRRLRRR